MPQEKTLQSIAKLIGQLVCVLAAIILACWAVLSFSMATDPAAGVPGVVSPRRLYVGCFLLFMGSSLWLQHAGSRVKAAKLAAIGALALSGVDFYHYFTRRWLQSGPFTLSKDVTSAIGLHIAVSGIIASLSLLFLRQRSGSPPRPWAARLSYAVGAISIASLFCQWLSVRPADTGNDFIGRDAMAACATASLILVSFGILCTRTSATVPRLIFSPARKGVLARRCLTVILLGPSVLILALLILERTNAINFSPGAAVLVTVYVLVGLTIALFSIETVIELTRQRQAMDDTRELFTARLQEQAAQLQETVAQRTLELAQANEDLGVVNGRLRMALRSSNFGVWELNIARGVLVWDDRMMELHGVRRESLTGLRADWINRLHPEDRDRAMATSNHVILGNADSFDTVYRIVRPDGTVRHVETHGILQRADDGTPLRLVGLVRDVTAEEELQEALNVAEERWKLAIEGSNDAVWDWNMKTGFVFHDSNWAGIVGYADEDIEPTFAGWRRLVHPEDLAACEAAMQQHIDQKTSFYQFEYRMRAKTGEWRWVLDRGKVVSRAADGKALRMVGTHTGITARKDMERHLLRTEELAEQVSRIALIGGWELDLVTGESTWTSGVNRICQLDGAVVPTMDLVLDLFPEEARQNLKSAFDDARSFGSEFDLELPLTTALGHQAWVRVLGRTETQKGKSVRIYGAMQDLTLKHESEMGRRKLEVQLFHAQKMETLGTLSGGIAHDFNNLLTGIIGYHELAAESVEEDHPARACLEEARKASLRARELVEQILTFGRQSSGMSLESTDITLVVEEARRFLRATLPSSIIISTAIAEDCPLVLADSTQVHQVLLNLGSNAAHAMRAHGGTLTIGLQKVEIDATRSKALGGLPLGDYVRLSVGDTGHGMDDATIHRIFEPFFTTKSTREGSGLGLAVVHGIVRAHRGAINVESTVGTGSMFHIYLPAVTDKRAPVVVGFARAPEGSGQSIVIVDDEDMVVRSAKVALEKKGYRVTMFTSAENCLEHLRTPQARCDALITDQTMPGMQGTELAAAARELVAGLPILIMSGYFTNISSRTLNELGPVTLLAKPFTSNELAMSLHQALNPASSHS
jgi:PAS domain S-box-containing protein